MSEVTGKGNLFDSMEGLEIIDDAKSEGEVGISSQEAASVGRRLKKGLRRDSTEEWLGRGSESRRESIHSRGVATLFNREKPDSDLIRTPQVENEENVAEEIDQYGYTIDKKYARLPGGWKVERKKYEELYDYQKEGVKWLYELFQRGKGGILADIMGMGKTIQVCVLLRGLLKGRLASRVLILCEKSLRDTWEKETSQWCGNWHIISLCGYNSASQREKKLKQSWLARNCIIIANQTFIRNDNLPLYSACDENASPMWEESDRVPWDIIVYDEAQRMRNPRTALFQHATIMRAKSKLLLTGTPIQNTPCDLWALMEIAVPGLLGDFAVFKNKFAEVIKRGNRREATELQEKNKDLAVEELNAVIYDYVLRREKYVDEITEGDVSKLEVIVWIGLSEEQLDIYKEYLNTRQVRRACSNNRDGSKGMHVLRCISTLRTLCNHPLFLLPPAEQKWRTAFGISLDALPQNVEKDDLQLSIAKNEDNNDEDDDDDEDVTWIDNDDGAMDNYKHMIRALPQDDGRKIEALSSKLQVLHCLLRRLKENGHRVLLFCPWTSMLDLVQYTILRTDGMSCLRIDGSTPSSDRQRKIRKFQNSKKYFAFVLSTRCGHVGLTLTAADRVVLISPSWNPSDDDQAVARAYRIGQRRDVIAYRLVCSGTIEERIFQREVTKIGDSKVILEDKDQAK
ncbi:DNA repair protein rad54, putative [Perkinsus marinus ATCC 50983]|uniref:DNA repair protein rad54, putative n=1 Tax=Perkinsus marinus (strain ATCC 50983 / TXsc) TaxID=423536 RepID=C5KJJ1_PERM5|nr:DNA repair protein rad54, putative [Perkinsus marinus ATCC 50983]EER15325.1 DNA repair protein rad54, putative [Perkinsus marinus ATCC 50983]|eukprot:XP_002783529.1 DNA repair protein rad54, putative [Perkinsus marinus ATCC 50983]